MQQLQGQQAERACARAQTRWGGSPARSLALKSEPSAGVKAEWVRVGGVPAGGRLEALVSKPEVPAPEREEGGGGPTSEEPRIGGPARIGGKSSSSGSTVATPSRSSSASKRVDATGGGVGCGAGLAPPGGLRAAERRREGGWCI